VILSEALSSSRPLAAPTVENPAISRISRTISRVSSWSSMTRTRCVSDLSGAHATTVAIREISRVSAA
jgi:hypothetical protein